MKRLAALTLSLAAAACFAPVEQRWCDQQNPCSAGFVCTSDFHCVSVSRPDGGSSGGGGGTVGGGGGAVGGGGVIGGGGAMGGGVPTGGGVAMGGGGGATGGGGPLGGGGASCGAASCSTGCCIGNNCVPANLQSNSACGFFGDRCAPCPNDTGCVMGRCVPVINPPDAGSGIIGAACTSTTQCNPNDPDSFCIPEFSGGQATGFTGGYCSRFCEDNICPGSAACVEAETGAGDIVHVCFASCMTSNDCRMRYFCDQFLCLP